jgi:hypothetical protein
MRLTPVRTVRKERTSKRVVKEHVCCHSGSGDLGEVLRCNGVDWGQETTQQSIIAITRRRLSSSSRDFMVLIAL